MTPTLQMLALVVWANGVPVLLRLLLGHRFGHPLDAGRLFRDGRPWLGASKTWRGLGAAVLTTPLLAVLLGLPWLLGLIAALGAMSGDLLASFLKRRLGRRPSESVLFLDEIPEALIPALLLMTPLNVSATGVVIVVIAFAFIDLLLTPVAARLRRMLKRTHGWR
ncbi:CDP-archaeol synthase [Thiocapsa rosea]|uniref:CDP-2,3-bis-(O-geranylgeranyl)-sn-glycerol synthase n=1 Tax=Thiocapsa rosea TaxID=69360 RepID=A0A495V8F6_9GAMM|nr:CDP-archaeol synthase [Thiocapsa rosea]RKT44785.1 CDP-2,3-bis-(O-geranylgeranyl)-sn-glycerol synthase [Thiocapsa rosea]